MSNHTHYFLEKMTDEKIAEARRAAGGVRLALKANNTRREAPAGRAGAARPTPPDACPRARVRRFSTGENGLRRSPTLAERQPRQQRRSRASISRGHSRGTRYHSGSRLQERLSVPGQSRLQFRDARVPLGQPVEQPRRVQVVR